MYALLDILLYASDISRVAEYSPCYSLRSDGSKQMTLLEDLKTPAIKKKRSRFVPRSGNDFTGFTTLFRAHICLDAEQPQQITFRLPVSSSKVYSFLEVEHFKPNSSFTHSIF